MRFLALTASALILAAACSQPDIEAPSQTAETDTSTAEASEGETSETAADALVSEDGFRLTPVAEGLEFPWDMLFLPDGTMLVTERSGAIRLVRDGELLPEPVAGTPEAHVNAQGGYFAMALDPNFASNRYRGHAKLL